MYTDSFNSDRVLFNQLVRVASANPQLRPALLPILLEEATRFSIGEFNRGVLAKGPMPGASPKKEDATDEDSKDKAKSDAQEKAEKNQDDAEKEREKQQEEARQKAEESSKKMQDLSVDSIMGSFEENLGKQFSTSFTTYYADRTDFTRFLEEAGDKIMVPSWTHWTADKNPVSSMLVNLLTFWTSKEYSLTRENMLRNTQAMWDWFQDFKYSAGLELLKNIIWDVPKMAADAIIGIAKAPLKLIKTLIEDTETAEWLVDQNIISYEMEVNKDYMTPKAGNFVTLSEFAKDYLSNAGAKQYPTRSWLEKLKASAVKFLNYAGKVLTVGTKSPLGGMVEDIDKTESILRKNEYVSGLMDHYFGAYVKANKFHMKRNMRNMIAAYIKDNKGDIAKKLKEQLLKAVEGKDLSEPEELESNLIVTPDNVQSVVDLIIAAQAKALKDSVSSKDLTDEEKSDLKKQLEEKDFSEDVARIGNAASRKVKPKIKHDAIGAAQGRYEGVNLGDVETVSHQQFDAMLNKEAAKGKEEREGNVRNSLKGIWRVLTGMGQDVTERLRKLKDVGKRFLKGPGKKGPTFQEWVSQKDKGGGFRNPDTGNQVKFDSLSAEEQAYIRKQFKEQSEKNEESNSEKKAFFRTMVRVAYQNPDMRKDLLPLLEKEANWFGFFSRPNNVVAPQTKLRSGYFLVDRPFHAAGQLLNGVIIVNAKNGYIAYSVGNRFETLPQSLNSEIMNLIRKNSRPVAQRNVAQWLSMEVKAPIDAVSYPQIEDLGTRSMRDGWLIYSPERVNPRVELVRLAYEHPKLRPQVLSFLLKEAAGWDNLPPGWTDESVKKFWKGLTKDNAKHPFTECVKKMKDKLDNPEAFCAATKDQALGTTEWRSTERKKNKKKALESQFYA